MGVLIPSVMALCETAMTAPLGQQGEPRAANGRPFPQGKAKDTQVYIGYVRKKGAASGKKDPLPVPAARILRYK